jgi:hypothetical protein
LEAVRGGEVANRRVPKEVEPGEKIKRGKEGRIDEEVDYGSKRT